MRRTKLFPFLLATAAFSVSACTSDSNEDTGGGTPDMGTVTPTDTGVPPDLGLPPDTGVPDLGPMPCLRDQGGQANRGCDPGEVCNLITGMCEAGRACTQDNECNPCSDLQNPEDCGHGFNLTAWCDANHGNVCVRSKAPCEPCSGVDDTSCGRPHPALPNITVSCLDYGNGEFFCGRSGNLGCPDGFAQDQDGMCRRMAGCDPDPVICPLGQQGQSCTSSQICPGETCPDTGGARCSTNDLPGSLGTCIGFCTSNADCDPATPICNTGNGICIAGCTAGSCPGGQVCHSDGFCAGPCNDNATCEADPRYGPDTYCNLRTQVQAPRLFKSYRDENACAPLGCERPVDCPQPGVVCDLLVSPPECVPGCFTSEDDCLSGEVCKRGPQGNYDREGCRALENKTDDTEIGVCCNPGCTDRVLQCDINDFCCGQEGSPYEDETTCLTVTSTSPTQAQPGECFEMGSPSPWCTDCDGSAIAQCMGPGDCANGAPCVQTGMGNFCGCENDTHCGPGLACSGADPSTMPPTPGFCLGCNSGWTPGFNVDPNINGGQPFQEQEWCVGIAMGVGVCQVSCNPAAIDNGCPRGWACGPVVPGCLQDADCGGLPCVGADTTQMPPIPGRCQCGTNGNMDVACPPDLNDVNGVVSADITNPRCVEIFGDGEFYCIAGYNCSPPPLQVNMMTGAQNYPLGCGF